jgi:hypothetical protein
MKDVLEIKSYKKNKPKERNIKKSIKEKDEDFGIKSFVNDQVKFEKEKELLKEIEKKTILIDENKNDYDNKIEKTSQ